MKNVAGFHSLLFATGLFSGGGVRLRKDFGIIVRQNEGCSIVGTKRVESCVLEVVVKEALRGLYCDCAIRRFERTLCFVVDRRH